MFGDDLTRDIPSFVPCKEVAFNISKLAEKIDVARAFLQSGSDVEQVCRWIMKIIVRSGLDVVMERENRYGRDLYPCYRAFAKYYPDRRLQMMKALRLAIWPTDEVQIIIAVLDGLGQWLLLEWDRIS